MSTLNEDLERGAVALRGITAHEVVVQPSEDIYVNFGYSEALVCEPIITVAGLRWVLTAFAWDQTHGVGAEYAVGVVAERELPGVAKAFLDVQDLNAQRLEDLTASIPEDL